MTRLATKSTQIGQMSREEATPKMITILSRCCDVYFGLRANQVSTDLLNKAANILFEKYPHVTATDIEHAFDRSTYEKKDWNGLKLSELMTPIYQWIGRRQKIVVEFEEHYNQTIKDSENEKKVAEYEEKALCIYRESLREHMENIEVHDANGEGLRSWLGTPFHANAIAKKYFAHQMDKEEKAFIWEKAKERFYYDNKKVNALVASGEVLQGALLGFTNTEGHKIRIFSDEIIHRALQMKLKPIDKG